MQHLLNRGNSKTKWHHQNPMAPQVKKLPRWLEELHYQTSRVAKTMWTSPDLIFGEASLDQLVEGLMNAMKWHRRKADGGKCVLHQLHGFRFRVVAEEFRQKLKKKNLKKMASLFKFCRQKILLSFLTLIRITHSFICWWSPSCS